MENFLKTVGALTIGLLSTVGIIFIWTGLDMENDDDTVIIEYNCSTVLKSYDEYPLQVIRECKAKRANEKGTV